MSAAEPISSFHTVVCQPCFYIHDARLDFFSVFSQEEKKLDILTLNNPELHVHIVIVQFAVNKKKLKFYSMNHGMTRRLRALHYI